MSVVTVFVIVFFLVYNEIGGSITQKNFVKIKRSFDLLLFRFLRLFAFTHNKELFHTCYSITIKLLRAFFVGFIVFVLLGGTPEYTPFLIIGTAFLIISFTSPKQLKLDFVNGFKFWTTVILFNILGLCLFWLIDLTEGTNHLTVFINMFRAPIALGEKQLGVSQTTVWMLLALTVIFLIVFFATMWLILRTSMLICFTLLKGYSRVCFCLNKKYPLKPAYLSGQLIIVLISYFTTS